MSAADTTEGAAEPLSSGVRAAAQGELPVWSRVTPKREAHIRRVSTLLAEWAQGLDLAEADQLRWAAAGTLHDALRDAEEGELREILAGRFPDLHPALLHGPAAAVLLDGQADEAILKAVRYHTLGHPDLDRLGRALYLADFLEPGRSFAPDWRGSLRARMPHELDHVLVEVLGARLEHTISARKAIRPETAAFWSAVVGGS